MMIKRLLLLISRIIVGTVFCFSGYVKVVDPLGFTYKVEDYLASMGTFMAQLTPLAFTVALIIPAIEFIIGISLLFGIRLKEGSWAAALMMVFMAPLTLWIAIFNPVHDCGCFGDALVISNWETFWKNVILSGLIAIIFIFLKEHRSKISIKGQWLSIIYAFIFSVGLSFYCYKNLPIIDFRPYAIGTDIIKSMEIPDGAEPDLYDIKLVYEKDGIQKEFTLENYPKTQDWTFVDQHSVLVKKGYEPPIHDFSMDTDEGDLTEMVLTDTSYTFLFISYDLKLADKSKSKEFNDIYNYAEKHNYGFYAMTSSVQEDIDKYIKKDKAEFPFVLSDKITLKTIVRSNPGLVLIKDGKILNKWHYRNLPKFNAPLENSELGKTKEDNTSKTIIISLLLIGIPLLIFFITDKFLLNRRD